MRAMSLRGLSVIALLWTVGVAILATRIGGFPAVLIVAVFILPLVFSSIDAAWQASVLSPSLGNATKSRPVRRPKPVPESAADAAPDTDSAPAPPEPSPPELPAAESVIPEPPAPVSLVPEPALPAGESLQL